MDFNEFIENLEEAIFNNERLNGTLNATVVALVEDVQEGIFEA